MCVYDPIAQQKAAEHVASGFVKEWKSKSISTKELEAYVANTVVHFANFMKHPSFTHEQEFRIVTSESSADDKGTDKIEWGFRPKNQSLISYVTVPMPEPIEIHCGPKSDKNTIEITLPAILERAKMKADLHISDSPDS